MCFFNTCHRFSYSFIHPSPDGWGSAYSAFNQYTSPLLACGITIS